MGRKLGGELSLPHPIHYAVFTKLDDTLQLGDDFEDKVGLGTPEAFFMVNHKLTSSLRRALLTSHASSGDCFSL